MTYSSGIILYKICADEEVRFFVCTPDGPYWQKRELYSFPKGQIEINETPFEAAIREFKEETSVQLTTDINEYENLGCIKQNKNKNVYIYAKIINGENLKKCSSNETITEYPYKSGIFITHKEIKKYSWLTLTELTKLGLECYLPIFNYITNKVKND